MFQTSGLIEVDGDNGLSGVILYTYRATVDGALSTAVLSVLGGDSAVLGGDSAADYSATNSDALTESQHSVSKGRLRQQCQHPTHSPAFLSTSPEVVPVR